MKRPGSLFLVCAMALTACKSQPSASPDEATAQPASAAAPSESGSGTLKPAPEKDPTDAALDRIPVVLEGVAAVRKLDFKAEIGAQRQSTEDFTKFVNRELDKELPADKSAELSKVLHHVGLLKEPVDLRETVTSALVSQVGAYYDPERGTFFVVMASGQPMMADVINAHELTHGLQDQHFDLEAYVGEGAQKGKIEFSTDEITARRFVVEGEATLVMSAYPVYVMGNGALLLESEQMAPMLEQQIEGTEKATIAQMLAMNAQQSKAQAEALGEDFAKAAAAIDKLPPYVTVPLMLPYVRGMTAVYRVYQDGGWEAVNKLYENPPSSSEQVLHPVEKLIKSRDEPVKLTIDGKMAALSGWKVVDDDTLGELMWQVYFSLWGIDETEPAAGWGGDHAMFLTKGDQNMGLFATVWDTPEDAKQFHEAYTKSLEARFGDKSSKTSGSTTTVERSKNSFVTVQRKGKRVAIVDGADPKIGKKLAKSLLKAKAG